MNSLRESLLLPNGLDDGSHTTEELYAHRAVLFSMLLYYNRENGWKSRKHYDGSMHEGYFIVGVNTPEGQVTYHYELKYWPLFDVKELEFAPQWDGHTPDDCLFRLLSMRNDSSEDILRSILK